MKSSQKTLEALKQKTLKSELNQLEKQYKTPQFTAAKLGISYSYYLRIKKGLVRPSNHLINHIELLIALI